ncbi:hypothetical protein Bequi_03480 [Brachybacterium sp. JHP9]|uniref:Uncharacterized protein n=1 Tax=Brachybacterium equifaecis TaxID=2910770 RepID=A0ABT0QZ50_9MICO|nr:hypothetical protein [Brachybacterium equifaecis]MCL6422453.1 hypothetical protein [Brachybacterium equifaecis]
MSSPNESSDPNARPDAEGTFSSDLPEVKEFGQQHAEPSALPSYEQAQQSPAPSSAPQYGASQQYGDSSSAPSTAPQYGSAPQFDSPSTESSSASQYGSAPQYGSAQPYGASQPSGPSSAQPFGAAPAPGAGPYGGAGTAAPQRPQTSAKTVRTLGTALLGLSIALLLVRLALSLTAILGAATLAANQYESTELDAGMIGVGLSGLVFGLTNIVLSIAAFVVSIIAIVKSTGRARVGAIIVLVSLVVSLVGGAIISFVTGIVLGAAGMTDLAGNLTADAFRISGVVDAIKVLVFVGVMIYGAWMVRKSANTAAS